MTGSCFKKKDTSPPVCGVHNVTVSEHRISIDSNAPGLGQVICFLCPVSRAVVDEEEKMQAKSNTGKRTQQL